MNVEGVELAEHDEAISLVESSKSKLALAESDLARVEIAGRTRAVSQQDIEQARSARDQAKAELLGARARLAQAERVTVPVMLRLLSWGAHSMS